MGTPGFTPVDDPATPKGFTPVDEGTAAPAQSSLGSSVGQYAREVGQGVVRGVQGLAGGVQSLLTPRGAQGSPQRQEEVNYGPVGRGLLHLGQDTAQGIANTVNAVRQSRQSGENWAGQTLSGLENLPFIGGTVKYAESGGPQMFNPKSVGAAAEGTTLYGGPKAVGAVADLPKTAVEFARRATSLNEVTKAGAGVYQGKVQPLIQTLRGAIQNEGARTIQQAIEADKAATMQQGRGTISPSAAVASAAQAIEDTGHMPSAQTRALLSRLNNSSFLTLEDAKNLRSDFGGAASKADRTGQAKLGKVLWSAYDELGNGMKDRVKELQGTTEPFEHYNNEFRAYYELNKGVAGSMQDSIMDRHEAMPKLKEFRDADLTEIKEQAQKYGMDPSKFDEAQKNSKAVIAAHDSLAGKYNKSVYRLVMAGGIGGGTAMSIYAAAHGAGLYGLAPMLAASYIASKVAGNPDQMETGSILKKLGVNPEVFQVRTPVEGPKAFDYPNQDDVFNPPSNPPAGSPPAGRPGAGGDVTPSGRPVPAEVQKIQQQRGGRGVASDVGSWQPPPELGAFSAPDYGKTAREANPEPTRKEVKAAAVKKAKNR